MKYLHSGYILFCEQADHTERGQVDLRGLTNLFVVKSLPAKVNCYWVIGFGTPFERRHYKGLVTLEDPDGKEVFRHEFEANDPSGLVKGHHIFQPEVTLTKEGMWIARVVLSSLKNDPIWDIERHFWTMLEPAAS